MMLPFSKANLRASTPLGAQIGPKPVLPLEHAQQLARDGVPIPWGTEIRKDYTMNELRNAHEYISRVIKSRLHQKRETITFDGPWQLNHLAAAFACLHAFLTTGQLNIISVEDKVRRDLAAEAHGGGR